MLIVDLITNLASGQGTTYEKQTFGNWHTAVLISLCCVCNNEAVFQHLAPPWKTAHMLLTQALPYI